MRHRDRSLQRRGRLGALLGFAAALLIADAVDAATKGELSFQQRVPEFDISGATSLTPSPDGNHLYATGDDTLTVLRVTASGDDYEYVETETEGVDDPTDPGGTVDGINGASDAVVSPDGKHVYVAGGVGESGVAIFDRNAATGALSFNAAVTDDDLTWAEAVAISPGGDHVYVAGQNDDTVVTFSRNSTTGALTLVEIETDGVDDAGDSGPTVDGLDEPTSLAVAPDGEGVYVGTDFPERSLVAFSRNTTTGKLNFAELEKDGVDDAGDPGGTVDGLDTVEDVVVSADNDTVYASGSFDDAIAVFERDTATEKLSFLEAEEDGVDDPTDPGGTAAGIDSPRDMALSADDDNLYAAGSTSDGVGVFRRTGSGKLIFLEAELDGADDPSDAGPAATGLDGASAVAVAPDDGHVFAGASNESGVAVLSRGAGLGALSFVRSRPDLRIARPTGMAISPDGEHMAVLAAGDDLLYSLERDETDGTVATVDTEIEGVDDPSDPGGAANGLYESSSVTFSPDGKHVYVTAYSEYSIAVFALNQATGELTYVETEKDGVDSGDGGGTVDGLYEPYSVAVSPDGKSVYAPGDGDDAITAFTRNSTTGRIVFAESELDGVGGVEGLGGADSVAVSPDDKHVYVGSESDEAVVVFARNSTTSQLAFVEVKQSTTAGGSVAALDSVADIVVSADGKQLYVLADDRVLRFDRNAANGHLTLAEVETDGVNDPTDPGGAVAGLSDAETLELSADGEELYVSGEFSPGSIATFSRNRATGALSFLEIETQGLNDPTDAGPTVEGLGSVSALAVSPDDRFLYATARNDNSLTIFSREDDFVAPDTTITGGPADGDATADSTPAFTWASSEAGSTFECSVDGAAFGACASPLPDLADGEHSFAVAATDSQGNPDATPAERAFTVDTELTGGKVRAKDKQKQDGRKIKVELKLTAGETARGVGKGKIKVGKKTYPLKKLTKDLAPGRTKVLKLKPKKSKDKKRIAKGLKHGKKASASLTGVLTDPVGNKLTKKTTVKLKRK